jgi:hypothetical protein
VPMDTIRTIVEYSIELSVVVALIFGLGLVIRIHGGPDVFDDQLTDRQRSHGDEAAESAPRKGAS